MIAHIINLACWDDEVFDKKKINENFFCDSFSFKVMALLFGYNLKRSAGSSYNYLIKKATKNNEAIFLTSTRKKNLEMTCNLLFLCLMIIYIYLMI